jgi:hypothetical protein
MAGFSVRGVVLGALVTAILAAAPATAVSASPLADPAVATLTASPNTGLADGQVITVTAAGYPLNHSLDLVECAQDVGCDFSTLLVLFSGDIGGYTTSFSARRLIHLEGNEIDCAILQNCILVSLDITDLSTGAQTSIAFDPNKPPLPPVNFRFTPDATGHVRVDKGVARITGTVRCNQVAVFSAYIQITQVYNRHIFQSDGFVDVSCTRDDQRWAVVFRPQNGLFGPGTATLNIDAYASNGTDFREKLKKVAVTLVPTAT